MALAVIAGVFSGAVCLALMFAGIFMTKRMGAQSSAAGYVTPILVSVGGSLVVLALSTVVCVVVARDYLLPFAVAEACTLVVVALGYGIAKAIRH